MKLLLEHGADANANHWWCGSILQLASRYGHEGIVRLLLKHGANINAQGGQYISALQAAKHHGHGIIAKLLLEHGTNAGAGCQGHTNTLEKHTSTTPLPRSSKRRLSRLDSESDLGLSAPKMKQSRHLAEPQDPK